MKQSRLMSLVESVANVIVGYGVAVVTQILIFPIFGLHTTLAQNLKMGAIFTIVSDSAFLRPAAGVRGDPDAERQMIDRRPGGTAGHQLFGVRRVRRQEVCTRAPDPRPSPRSLRAPSFFFSAPAIAPRTVCDCQPVAAMNLLDGRAVRRAQPWRSRWPAWCPRAACAPWARLRAR